MPFPPDVSYGGVHFNSRPDLHRSSFWYPTIRFGLKPLIVGGMVSTLAPRIRFDRLDGRIMRHHLILIAPSSFSRTDFLDATPSFWITRKSNLSTINFLIARNPTSMHQQYIVIERMRLRGPTVYFVCHKNDLGTCSTF